MFARHTEGLDRRVGFVDHVGISAIGTDGDRTIVPVNAVASGHRGRRGGNGGKIDDCFRFAVGYGIDVGVVR